jgi:glycosyltransferase involved in cell wall biosynthesis
MKKILFISTRNPYSNRYTGDIIGSKKIINMLKKNNVIDVVALGDRKDFSQKNIFIFKKPFFFNKFLHALKSLILLQPIQLGFFYSNEMKIFINDNAVNYDIIFFYHIRSSQYLPKNYYGKKIIEMGDLYSNNYHQTFKNLNIFNPLKYIYFLESLLVRQLEKKIFINFDKIILFSKNEIKKIEKVFSKNIIHINISTDKIKKKYLFSKKNNKIIFIGNLKYLPNILAVKKFAKNILPKLKKKIPDIKFEIIGEINNIDKFLLSKNEDIKCWGSQKNLDKFIKGSFCGLANLEIATGVQGKILTYMSYGLPVICSKRVASNFEKNVISYNDDIDIIDKIKKLKNDKKSSNYVSKKSFNFIKKFDWKKVSKEYLKIIKN